MHSGDAHRTSSPWSLQVCTRSSAARASLAPDAVPSVISQLNAQPHQRGAPDFDLVLQETIDWLTQLEASRARRTSASASADAELP